MPAEYVPTDAHRALVESASAFGITQAEIDGWPSWPLIIGLNTG
jgi:hypothetical protein